MSHQRQFYFVHREFHTHSAIPNSILIFCSGLGAVNTKCKKVEKSENEEKKKKDMFEYLCRVINAHTFERSSK